MSIKPGAGHFADKRIKNIDKSNTFIVDDRTDCDIAADGSLYGWFCTMFLEVNKADQVTLTFGAQVPMNDRVQAWFNAHNAKHDNRGCCDFRRFNDAVVLGGSVPMTVLGRIVDNYIEREKARG